jgi:outer membrane receptor protein involved in Fe transport
MAPVMPLPLLPVRRWFLWIAALLVAGGLPGVVCGQTSSGSLVGLVVDPQGAAVTEATIVTTSPQYGVPHEARTDSLGAYRIESLQPGTYTITISKPSFSTLTVTDIVIHGSVTATVNGKLELAGIQQAVEVEAGPGQVFDTQSGQLGETLTNRELTQLPYASLNPVELALTLPGVHDTPQGQGAVNTLYTNGVAFSVNGTRPRSNNFLIDGQDDNDYGIAGQAFQPTNAGAIEEVTILTNAYSAEYGRGGGSVSNYIYKSGTNRFHADAWEINRNSALAAIPAEDQVSNPITKNPFDNDNTFGFDVGGPLKKDTLFLFGTAQWDRERQQVIGPTVELPTANGIATLKTLLPNSNISLLLAAIGNIESPGLNGVTDIVLGNGRPDVEIGDVQWENNAASNSMEWNVRTDWHISDRDTLTGSILRSNQTLSPDIFSNSAALPNFQTQQGGPSDIYRGQWVHILSSRLVNELRLSHASFDFEFQPTAATLAGPLANIPFISFGPDLDFPQLGVNDRFPQGRAHRTWQLQDGLTFEKGRHTLKAGADITLVSIRDLNGIATKGAVTYSSGGTDGSGATYSSLGNFIDDYTGADPGGISRTFGNPVINPSATMYAPYVEDVWRVKENLTLNLGLRYESWGTIANSLSYPAFNVGLGFGVPSGTFPGMYSYQQVPDRKNFAPRIGLAYTPRWGGRIFGENKTVIRAGYGIFYDGLFSDIVDLTATSEPNISGGSLAPPTGRGYANASTVGLSSITATEDPTLAVTTMASDIRNPMTQQWNLDVQRELPWGLVVTVAYVGTRGEHLFVDQDFNGQINYAFANPNFGEISVRTNGGDSRYNSGQLEIERKMHAGLTFRASYDYSKFMDDASEIFPTTGTSTFSQDLLNQRSDWGPSAFDQRHRFTLAYVWELPYSRRNGFVRALTNRWQSSSVVTFETGTPNTVEIGFDNVGNGHPNSRPNLANPSAPLNSFGIDGGDVGGPYASGTYYDFNCVYIQGNTNCPAEPLSTFHFVVPNTTPGNVGRNTLYGPGQAYFDTSIQRDFPVRFGKQESESIQFRTEFFNALNHPNLYTPSYTMTDPNFDNTAITINGGRQIKFWLKYSF